MIRAVGVHASACREEASPLVEATVATARAGTKRLERRERGIHSADASTFHRRLRAFPGWRDPTQSRVSEQPIEIYGSRLAKPRFGGLKSPAWWFQMKCPHIAVPIHRIQSAVKPAHSTGRSSAAPALWTAVAKRSVDTAFGRTDDNISAGRMERKGGVQVCENHGLPAEHARVTCAMRTAVSTPLQGFATAVHRAFGKSDVFIRSAGVVECGGSTPPWIPRAWDERFPPHPRKGDFLKTFFVGLDHRGTNLAVDTVKNVRSTPQNRLGRMR